MSFEISTGKRDKAKKIVIYGPEGVGKTTFAMQFPKPVFIDTEGSTDAFDVSRLPKPKSLEMLKEEIRFVAFQGEFKTLVIDTGDWMAHSLSQEICFKNGVKAIADFSYGKGYGLLDSAVKEVLEVLEEIRDQGINVIINCHSKVSAYTPPNEGGSYDRYTLKVSDRLSPFFMEWADIVAFINFKTILVEKGGMNKDKKRAIGGQERWIHFTHTPSWDGKNRYGLPESAKLDYELLRPLVEFETPKPEPVHSEKAGVDMCIDLSDPAYEGVNEELLGLMMINGYDHYTIEHFAEEKWPDRIDVCTPLNQYPPELQQAIVKNFKTVKEIIDKAQYAALPF